MVGCDGSVAGHEPRPAWNAHRSHRVVKPSDALPNLLLVMYVCAINHFGYLTTSSILLFFGSNQIRSPNLHYFAQIVYVGYLILLETITLTTTMTLSYL